VRAFFRPAGGLIPPRFGKVTKKLEKKKANLPTPSTGAFSGSKVGFLIQYFTRKLFTPLVHFPN
jgi:hypothetical protein